jgi:hypothetical protein
MMFVFRLFLACALCLGAMGAPVKAQESQNQTDWKQGAWGALAPYIGTYKYSEVLNDPAVSEALSKALGDEKDHLLNNLKVHNPIGFEDDCLIMSGNGEKTGSSEKAYLNVCLYAGKINAVIFSKGTVSVYSTTKKYEYLPLSLREWVYRAKNQDAFQERPDYVQMMSLAQ